MHRSFKVLGTISATVALLAVPMLAAGDTVKGTASLAAGQEEVVKCGSKGSLTDVAPIANNSQTLDCAKVTTTTTPPTTTPPTTPVAEVQADDTGTFTGNTTSLASGTSHQVLAHNTAIGDTVVLTVQTLTNPGTQTDTISSITSAMGTFQFVNSYNDGADYEIWVCTKTTGAADSITVNTSTNAWDALAVEFNQPSTGVINGGGTVANLGYLSNQSWTVTPAAAGNVAFVAVDTSDAYTKYPAAPWTSYNAGYWSASNGTSAAWQVTTSASPVTATWQTDGGLSNSNGLVLEFGGTPVTTTSTPPTTTPPTTTTTPPAGGNCTDPVWQTSAAEGTDNLDPSSTAPELWWMDNDAWNGGAGPQSLYVCSQSSWYATSTQTQTNSGGAVETYPSTEYDVTGRGGPGIAISAAQSITSTFSEDFPPAGSWDAAYDMWTNNWGTETMVWNADAGTQTYWNTNGTPVTIGGVNYEFVNFGSEYVFIMQNQEKSGSLDILGIYNWEVSQGLAKGSDMITQLEYGVEICTTVGTETFPVNGLTFDVS